jgi:colanic acid/amylovoran biosynthesis glycosyltransferase
MNIAVVVEKFPSLSETFVLGQITWLLEAGHDVRIFAARRSTGQPVPQEFERFNLVQRTRYARAFRGGHHRRQLQLGSFLLGQVALGKVSASAVIRGYERSGMRSLPVWTYPRGDSTFDVILAHFGPNGVHALEMRRAGVLNGPVATVFHGYDMNQSMPSIRRGYERLLAEGDLFLPVSRYFRDRLLEWGAPSERTVVHHMGVDPHRFAFRSRALDDDEPLKLVSVARFVSKKGLEFGIRAAAMVGSEVRYTIIGDGPERPRLEALIEELDTGNIELTGWLSHAEVARRLAESHVLLAPSVTSARGEEEGIPVALMEAMATGLPVIATRHSGIPELVQHDLSGFLVDERDAGQIADCIRLLLASPARLGTMGRAGREIVERDFNIHKLHPRLVELLNAAT